MQLLAEDPERFEDADDEDPSDHPPNGLPAKR